MTLLPILRRIQRIFQLRKELTCLTNLQEIARAKEAIRKDGRRRQVDKWQTRWHGDQSRRWTHRLIPELATWLDRKHGQVGFYLAQAFWGHGCFNAYLKHFKKRDDESCRYCGSFVENAEHTLFVCACLTGVCPRMGVPGELTTEESYATLSWNQLPAKFIGSRESFFLF